jgi:hypothetical protein
MAWLLIGGLIAHGLAACGDPELGTSGQSVVTTLCGYPQNSMPTGPSIGSCLHVCNSTGTDGSCDAPDDPAYVTLVYGCVDKTDGAACDGYTNDGVELGRFTDGHPVTMSELADAYPEYCTFQIDVGDADPWQVRDFVVWQRDECAPVCTTPPVPHVGHSPVLWPPNHKYHRIDLLRDCQITWESACGPVSPDATAITCVSSNEPDDGLGDGDTSNDIVIVDDHTVDVRAERSGTGAGRCYTIRFQLTDSFGNVGTGQCSVGVPHDQHGPNPCGPASLLQDPIPAETVCAGEYLCGEPQTCSPSDFDSHASWPGVQLYKYNGGRAEYVAVVDRSLATVSGLVDRVPEVPYTYHLHASSYFTEHASEACPSGTLPRLVRNGIFFSGNSSTSGSAHGLRIDGGFVDLGYTTAPSGTPLPPEQLTAYCSLGFDNGGGGGARLSAPWSSDDFGFSQAFGGFEPGRIVSGSCRPRNFVGIVPGTSQMVFYSSRNARGGRVSPARAQAVLRAFGAPDEQQLQLDGGGSVFLAEELEGAFRTLVPTDGRSLAHGIVVCTPP